MVEIGTTLAAERLRLLADKTEDASSLGAEFVYDNGFKSEEWPHGFYPLLRSDLVAVVDRAAHLDAALTFLAARRAMALAHAEPRCYGISSDAMAWYGTGFGPEPGHEQYPWDIYDLAACERTYEMAPVEVQAVMFPVLELFRWHVAARGTNPTSGSCPNCRRRDA